MQFKEEQMKWKNWLFISLLFSANSILAKVDVSPLFVQLSDAMAEAKKGEIAKSQQNLTALQQHFLNLEQNDSIVGIQVKNSLKVAIDSPNVETLEQLAKNLYSFEKEQNPVNYGAKHQDFIAKMAPLYVELKAATQSKDLTNIKKAARQFGQNWAKHEKAVREISLTHYGKFERILGLLRITVNAEKADLIKIDKLAEELGIVMAEFNQLDVK
ncbi:High-affinity Fe2+/Pb2+ permease [Mannheimia varigena USDA-ARS-USMARC-1296]|uniref:High-affinity Fe2+/Pb2+ permease n=2 Tax=Mannheimia varigena TaxID=85404 RepID=W0QCP1_9PAST|nr:High-affinity Fe2+/Pb2+ permease [Mannheimia varigena USDA-ARS-USMARC-1296]